MLLKSSQKKNQHLRKLKKEHTKFLKEFIDNNPIDTLDQMVDALSDKFEGLSISKSGVDKHLKESCSYTLKKITKIPAKRNSPDVIELRFRAVEAWIKDSNISFMQNCIFIDEAGFNLHTWKEFMAFLIHVMDVLDKHNLKGCNLVMDNAPIHKPEKIMEEVSKRGYRIIYLPPYSPFLNPIEEFWAKVKTLVRRSPMTDRDNLVARIREAAEQATPEDYSLSAIARQFSSPTAPSSFTFIHVPIHRRLPIHRLRANLRDLHINTRRILDIQYSDRNVLSFLIHTGFEPELRFQLYKHKITIRDDFDPLSRIPLY
ncbi:hypothetical protein G6F43_013086 [Rhizopus delemar]|nr:hypothetical protein G6F43_013086 [Rhizopus delemar]